MATEIGKATSYPTAYTTSGSIYGTRYKNAIGKGSDTSAVTGNDYASSNGSTADIYYSFDFSSIPEDAEITSVSCTVKGHCENTRNSTAKLRMYAGNTEKGSERSFSSTSAQTLTLTVGTWSRSEIDSMRLRFTIGYYGGLVNGVTVIVNYKYDSTTWSITINNQTSVSASASDIEPHQGKDVEISVDSIDGITITDNGNDVTSQFVKGQSDTESAFPISYEVGGSIHGTYYQQAIGKGSDTADTTGSDYFSTTQGASGSTYIDYYFDFSAIPSNATLKTVSVTVKGHAEDLSQTREIARCQLYSGSVAKGEPLDFEEETDMVYSLTTGEWARAELDDAKLRFTIGVYGGRLSGATWTVTYEVDGYVYIISSVSEDHTITIMVSSSLYLKVSGNYKVVMTAYRKENGAWVEADKTQIFNDSTNYRNGD